VVKGLGLSPGFALGPVYYLENELGDVPRRRIRAAEVEPELRRLRDALEEAAAELRRQRDAHVKSITETEKRIFDTHLELYQDDLLRESVEARVRKELLNAEAALQDEVAHLAGQLASPTMGELFQQRVADLRDVANRVHRVLLRRQQAKLATGQPVVLCARELLPSDTLTLDRRRLLAIVTEVGGEASHVAILARASGIPAVSGIQNLAGLAPPGTELGVDGVKGRLVVAPTARQRVAIERTKECFAEDRRRLAKRGVDRGTERERGLSLLLNIENFDGLDPAVLRSADGIGLYRTEFLFMGRSTFPSEEEQYAFYKKVLSQVDGRHVTFRTIDVGGDKPLQYLVTPREQNPALGWRGIRLTFDWPDLLYPQLRALLRAAVHGPLEILLPMVTNAEEVREAKRRIAELQDDLRRQKLPFGADVRVGAMIEVPAAALAADAVMEEADFLSIGTNDLLQYLFAVDRNNLQVAKLYQPLHPAVLTLLQSILTKAKARQREVTVCGEMAGQLLSVLALYGAGLRRFSMSPAHLPEARTIFRHFSAEEADVLFRSVISLRSHAEVERILREVVLEKAGADAAPFLPRRAGT
jgi:phosphotransferase system enzyme I (PtsI)